VSLSDSANLSPDAIQASSWLWPDALDAVIAAPKHHVVLFENDRVRVLETLIRPGERTPMHTHRWPMTLHTISRSEFVRYDVHGKVVFDSRENRNVGGAEGGPPAPKVGWLEPLPPHALENVGTQNLHVISVEVKG